MGLLSYNIFVCELTSSSAEALFALGAKKRAFYAVFDIFRLVVTSVKFGSNLGDFENYPKNPKTVNNKKHTKKSVFSPRNLKIMTIFFFYGKKCYSLSFDN